MVLLVLQKFALSNFVGATLLSSVLALFVEGIDSVHASCVSLPVMPCWRETPNGSYPASRSHSSYGYF